MVPIYKSIRLMRKDVVQRHLCFSVPSVPLREMAVIRYCATPLIYKIPLICLASWTVRMPPCIKVAFRYPPFPLPEMSLIDIPIQIRLHLHQGSPHLVSHLSQVQLTWLSSNFPLLTPPRLVRRCTPHTNHFQVVEFHVGGLSFLGLILLFLLLQSESQLPFYQS
jgi:hypothetical protein